jgi:hypothetical protein
VILFEFVSYDPKVSPWLQNYKHEHFQCEWFIFVIRASGEVKLKDLPFLSMQAYTGIDLQTYSFRTWALDGDE